jgi:hypothetical protein
VSLLSSLWGSGNIIIFFRIPHIPLAGSLKVLRAPAHRGGIRCASQTKIYNLETEFFFLARGSFGPEIFVSDFFWRQSPSFLALQVEGLLAHIVTVLVIVPR